MGVSSQGTFHIFHYKMRLIDKNQALNRNCAGIQFLIRIPAQTVLKPFSELSFLAILRIVSITQAKK